ncbi:MAG: YeaH/YhbH family protein [Gammaproteobacteria bacterium]|nr:YeaH/YhbH family protein [Gammaproteobacteria bacterium]
MHDRIIDRRLDGKDKSAENRRRFIARYKAEIKKAVSEAITGRSIKEIEKSGDISIPTKDITEPSFRFGKGGRWTTVFPGNREFIKGDKIPRKEAEAGKKGSAASPDLESKDDFVFQISKDEFVELFFEDLELPNLTKKKLSQGIQKFRSKRAGFTLDGTPTNINIIRSLRSSLARRMALAKPHERQLARTQEQYRASRPSDPNRSELEKEIARLQKKIKAVPFIDPIDLRYNYRVKKPEPFAKAVMFCLMDVSGSMDQTRKDVAKRFFILLYLFLKRHYKETHIIFIRHHTNAKEVGEEEFFYSQETGGTVVSSALRLTHQIIKERFREDEWNIYIAQASDGDNWGNDSPICRDILVNQLIPLVQYFAYVEITSSFHQSLWREYLLVKDHSDAFVMQHIERVTDIYPVFRQLFKKQE